MIVCGECGKTYKTRGGFERHRAAKHGQQSNTEQQLVLTPDILDEIVHSAMLSVKEKKVYPPNLRNEVNLYTFEELDETEFNELKAIFDGLAKNGDAEKFYGKYFTAIPLKSTSFFKGLSRNAATLLSTKVADCMLAYCKRVKSAPGNSKDCNSALSEREKVGLQYLGGYVVHNLHKNIGQGIKMKANKQW